LLAGLDRADLDGLSSRPERIESAKADWKAEPQE
jgi:hypothetical protein